VRVQARELGIDETGEVTVTGGMAFGGGPLNNFVLQALARMAHVLRADPGTTGIVNAISGVITKQGVSLWSTEPSEGHFHHDDVSEAVSRETPRVEVAPEADGAATVASYTVLHSGAAPQAVLLCDLPDGRRTLTMSNDAELIATAEQQELCGRPVALDGAATRLA
jgi:acetyl-CoA C-acetyltransferase